MKLLCVGAALLGLLISTGCSTEPAHPSQPRWYCSLVSEKEAQAFLGETDVETTYTGKDDRCEISSPTGSKSLTLEAANPTAAELARNRAALTKQPPVVASDCAPGTIVRDSRNIAVVCDRGTTSTPAYALHAVTGSELVTVDVRLDRGPTRGDYDRALRLADAISTCRAGDSNRPCFEYRFIRLAFCDVQAIRNLLRENKIKVTDLPEWIDHTSRDGAPLLIDWQAGGDPQHSLDRKHDELAAAVAARGQTIDQYEVHQCEKTTTEASMEKIVGGPLTGRPFVS